jgi:hypothetical protein
VPQQSGCVSNPLNQLGAATCYQLLYDGIARLAIANIYSDFHKLMVSECTI